MEEGGGASAEAAAASDAECGLRTIHGREGKLNFEEEKRKYFIRERRTDLNSRDERTFRSSNQIRI